MVALLRLDFQKSTGRLRIFVKKNRLFFVNPKYRWQTVLDLNRRDEDPVVPFVLVNRPLDPGLEFFVRAGARSFEAFFHGSYGTVNGVGLVKLYPVALTQR